MNDDHRKNRYPRGSSHRTLQPLTLSNPHSTCMHAGDIVEIRDPARQAVWKREHKMCDEKREKRHPALETKEKSFRVMNLGLR